MSCARNEFKGIGVPRREQLDAHKDALVGGWATMLAHQLPALPPVETFWDALGEFFTWLLGGEVAQIPAAYVMAAGETVVRERSLRLPVSGSAQSFLEIIRFAAANRLCVDLDYQGRTRRIEPYSLRHTQEDNLVLHAWSVDRNEHRSYRVDRIEGARSTGQVFTPRYAMELTPSGPLAIAPTTRSDGSGSLTMRGSSFSSTPVRRSVKSKSPFGATGPSYIYQCGVCGKKFRRSSMDSKLNEHKGQSGFKCPGRIGIYVETKY